MLSCLYTSDYGPPDPSFDPIAAAAASFGSGWADTHRAEIATAQNAYALQAVKRKIDRGEPFVWCEQGYGWTHSAPIDGFFIVVIALVLPYALVRLMRRLGLPIGACWRQRPAEPAE